MRLLLSAGLTLFIILFSFSPVFSDPPIENIHDHPIEKINDVDPCENNRKVMLEIQSTTTSIITTKLIDVCHVSYLDQSYRITWENGNKIFNYSQLYIWMDSGQMIPTLSGHVEILEAMGQIAK